jgi:hypothetical protein
MSSTTSLISSATAGQASPTIAPGAP